MAAVNLEIKSLNRTIDKFTESLDLDAILDSLLARDLITGEIHGELNETIRNGKRVAAIRKVIDEIKLNPPGFLDIFIEVLKDNTKTAWLGDILAEG